MSLSNKRIINGVELSALILGLLICMTSYNIYRANTMDAWLKHSNVVLTHTSLLQLVTVKCEMIVRDYMLTGDKSRLLEFRKANASAVSELNTLKRLTLDNANLQRPLESASIYIGKAFSYSGSVIKGSYKQGAIQAISTIKSAAFRSAFDQASFHILLVQQGETGLLESRQIDFKRSNLIMNTSFCVTVGFIVILVGVGLRRSKKELIERGHFVEDLLKSSEQMKMAERLGSFGVWSINMENWAIVSSDEMYRMWGYKPGKQESTLANYLLKVHPDDQAFVKSKMQDLVNQRNVDYYDFRLEENGIVKYITTGITVIRDIDDKLLSVTGYAQDVTEKTNASIKQEESTKELGILFNRIGDVLYSRDMILNTLIQVSSTCIALYGYTLADFIAEPNLFITTIHPDDRHFRESANSKLEKGEETTCRYRIRRKNEEIRWVENKIIPTMDHGRLIRIDGVMRDVTNETLISMEREQFIADLLQQNKTLEHFAHMVSHDLRVPIANILGLSQIFEMSINDFSEEDRNVVLKILVSVHSLDQITRDLNEVLKNREQIIEIKIG
jgi:PAS domain-containing protein